MTKFRIRVMEWTGIKWVHVYCRLFATAAFVFRLKKAFPANSSSGDCFLHSHILSSFEWLMLTISLSKWFYVSLRCLASFCYLFYFFILLTPWLAEIMESVIHRDYRNVTVLSLCCKYSFGSDPLIGNLLSFCIYCSNWIRPWCWKLIFNKTSF